jgi:hypothetical protein
VKQPSAIAVDSYFEHLRYRGVRLKKHVLSQDRAIPPFHDLVWQSFKKHCATEGNILPLLIYNLEPQDPDPGMFRRRGPRNPKGGGQFEDLPAFQRAKAIEKFRELCEKWSGNLPSWRRAILAGVARRLALHPPDSDWGRRMRRIKGGVHCQKRYRELGWHPLDNVSRAMAKRHNASAHTAEGAHRSNGSANHDGKRLAIPLEQMRGMPKITPLLEQAGVRLDRIIEAIRFSDEEDAVTFLKKYDSLAESDRDQLSIEEICVVSGIPARRFLTLAVSSMMEVSLLVANLIASSSLVEIGRKNIERACTDKGIRDRDLFFKVFFEYLPSLDAQFGIPSRCDSAHRAPIADPVPPPGFWREVDGSAPTKYQELA